MKSQNPNPRTKGEIWFLIAVIALLAVFAIAPWSTGQRAAASDGPAPFVGHGVQADVGNVVAQTGSALEPAEQSDPTSTPQPVFRWQGESRHSAGAALGSTPLSLTGSYYQWGYAKTCHDIDWSTSPPTCIGETNTFYCDDEAMYNLGVIYNVTQGGYARVEVYMPDGTLLGYCEGEIEDPYDYGYDYWSWYAFSCGVPIAGSQTAEHPGQWHSNFYVW
ncbi:MAG TPA: hypothetical protein EYP55_03605, partial [Anaerolineae bacterium]|nr:hypothetical protein [Anaerolineae bacterium]